MKPENLVCTCSTDHISQNIVVYNTLITCASLYFCFFYQIHMKEHSPCSVYIPPLHHMLEQVVVVGFGLIFFIVVWLIFLTQDPK